MMAYEIWSHNSCTRYALLASSQVLNWIQNTDDRLQRTSWQGTYLHPRNEPPITKQKIFHKIQWITCAEGSKIQAWYILQACIRSAWTSGMELLAKEIRLCDEIEAFKQNLKTHLFVKFVNESTLAIWFWRIIVKHPRMLSAEFVVLYKRCKPKPNLNLCYQGIYESLGLNEFTKLEKVKVNEGIWNHLDSSCPYLICKANVVVIVHGLLIEANFCMNLIFLKHIKIPRWTLSYPICIHNFTPWDFNDTQAGPLQCWYLSVTYSKLKSYEILFDHKIHLGRAIILKF